MLDSAASSPVSAPVRPDDLSLVNELTTALAGADVAAPLPPEVLETAKLAAIGGLAAGVAHELNNAVFGVLGLAELLLKNAEPGTKSHEWLTLIQQTGLDMKAVLRALLDFAREPSEEPQHVALRDVVSQTIELVRRTSAAKDVELVLDLDPVPAPVHGSPNQLKQILLGLLTNAYEAMPDGGTVSLALRRDGQWAAVTVGDTGPGVAESQRTRIFAPFFTTKERAAGLGLAIGRALAETHGGTLDLAPVSGGGAAFTLRLPIATEVRA